MLLFPEKVLQSKFNKNELSIGPVATESRDDFIENIPVKFPQFHIITEIVQMAQSNAKKKNTVENPFIAKSLYFLGLKVLKNVIKCDEADLDTFPVMIIYKNIQNKNFLKKQDKNIK